MPVCCQAPNCENLLNGKRVDAKYCSAACKLAAYHSRTGTVTRRQRDHNMCQREGCGKAIPEHLRADSKYCSNACRQKVYHETHKEEARKRRDKVRFTKIAEKAKKEEKKAVEDFIKELMG